MKEKTQKIISEKTLGADVILDDLLAYPATLKEFGSSDELDAESSPPKIQKTSAIFTQAADIELD